MKRFPPLARDSSVCSKLNGCTMQGTCSSEYLGYIIYVHYTCGGYHECITTNEIQMLRLEAPNLVSNLRGDSLATLPKLAVLEASESFKFSFSPRT